MSMDKTEKVVLGSVTFLIVAVVLGSLVFVMTKAQTTLPAKDAPLVKVNEPVGSSLNPKLTEHEKTPVEPKEVVPFAFVDSRERMMRFAFARLVNAKYKIYDGPTVSNDDFRSQTLGAENLISEDRHGNEIQARVSLQVGLKNFIWVRNESAATTANVALDAALEFEDILTWCDATQSVTEALSDLAEKKKSSELTHYIGKSKTRSTQVGSGVASWTVQISEQPEADSYGGPWSSVTIDWDWSLTQEATK